MQRCPRRGITGNGARSQSVPSPPQHNHRPMPLSFYMPWYLQCDICSAMLGVARGCQAMPTLPGSRECRCLVPWQGSLALPGPLGKGWVTSGMRHQSFCARGAWPAGAPPSAPPQPQPGQPANSSVNPSAPAAAWPAEWSQAASAGWPPAPPVLPATWPPAPPAAPLAAPQAAWPPTRD